jgi:calcineurin-like phosphoesterase family protein
MVMRINNRDIFVTHRPNDVLLHYDIYLVGHVHDKWKHKILNDGYRKHILINVGVDVNNFYPIKFDEILHYIKQIETGKNDENRRF